MQPVQYRGYAQGTAFNPIILSDQSRKILEQNEQFLRGLQAKQKIERDFEVAKLKQLQENIRSQRQQLNENYGYDQRQKDRYNQSLQANAAREVQDLKRIAALDANKPTTAAVVNQVADFLVGASETAATVIGKVREAKDASDQASANEIQQSGELTDAYIGNQVGGQLVYDIATNKVISVFATAKAFKESGYELQEGQQLFSINEAVQQKIRFSSAQAKFKNFSLEFKNQAEYKFNGETISRQQFAQLSAADKKAVFDQQYVSALNQLQEESGFSPYMLQQLTSQKGTEVSKYYGDSLKAETKIRDGQMVEAARLEAVTHRRPVDLHNYANIVAISNGGDRSKGVAALKTLLSDADLITDAEFEKFADTTFTDQLGNQSTFRQRNSVTYNEIIQERAKSELAAEKLDDTKRKLLEQRKINAFHEAFDVDKRDGTIDGAKQQDLVNIAAQAGANEEYDLQRLAIANIKITADYQLLETQRNRLDELYAANILDERHVRDSGLQGEEFSEYLEKAREVRSVVAPTKDNLGEAESVIKADLRERQTGGYAYQGPMSASYYTGVRRETNRYTRAYVNEMRKSGDHATAHNVAMGVVNGVIGTDPSKGLYRVANTYDEIVKQLKAGGRVGDFVDSSLHYAPLDKQPNTITEIRERVDELGVNAIKTVVTPQRLKTTFNNYRETGRVTIDPALDVVRKLLDIPYAEAHNLAAEQLGDNSLKLPKKLYDGAIQVESAARGTSLAKFLKAQADLDREVTTSLVLTELSGQPFQQSAAAQAANGDFDGLFNSLEVQESGGDPSKVNKDSGATGFLQIMPDNIGPWSKEILGREMTKEEFLADPEAQRKVGRGKLRQYYNVYLLRGESPDEAIRKAAASWYAGPNWESAYGPNYHNDNKPQMYGGTEYPSMLDYTTKVLNRVRGR